MSTSYPPRIILYFADRRPLAIVTDSTAIGIGPNTINCGSYRLVLTDGKWTTTDSKSFRTLGVKPGSVVDIITFG